MPLQWHLVPDNMISKVAANFAKRVIADTTKLDVGLLGTKAILNVLSANGYADLAYQLAANENYPSWGWWIKNGMTTLSEGWSIENRDSISLNHIMFGEISAWMNKALGGIRTDSASPGFKHILLQPDFVKWLDTFYCEHEGPYGKIISSWKRKNDVIFYEVTKPPGSTASMVLEGNKNNLN